MIHKTEVMTIPEFLKEYRERELRITEHKLGQKKLMKKVVFVLACLLIAQHARDVYAVGDLTKVDKAGSVILGICRKIGYWVCLIMCIIEIIKTSMQGDTKSIAKIIAKYLLLFGAMYLVPWLFDLIKSIFA